jgi:hypothetical protein
MVIRYSMPDNGKLPWTQYGGSIRVQAAGEDCVVLLHTEFIPVGEEAAVLRQMSASNIDAYFGNLQAAVDRAQRDDRG